MDYFSLFDLPVHYRVDMHVLASRFKKKQILYHPDQFANRTKEEQLAAVSLSALINKAWKTLRNPLTRAEYLLSLYGFDLNKQHTIQESTFLIEQLQFYEELHEIEQTKDNRRLKKLIKHVEDIYNNYYQIIMEQLNDKKFDIAVDTVRKLRFLDKLRSRAEKLEEMMLDL